MGNRAGNGRPASSTNRSIVPIQFFGLYRRKDTDNHRYLSTRSGRMKPFVSPESLAPPSQSPYYLRQCFARRGVALTPPRSRCYTGPRPPPARTGRVRTDPTIPLEQAPPRRAPLRIGGGGLAVAPPPPPGPTGLPFGGTLLLFGATSVAGFYAQPVAAPWVPRHRLCS